MCVQEKEERSPEELRNEYVTKKTKEDQYRYLADTPKEIRSFAIKEYIVGKKNAKDQYKKKLENEEYKKGKYKGYKPKVIKMPETRFRKKKSDQSITINKDAIKIKNGSIHVYPKSFTERGLTLRNQKKDKKLQKIINGEE
jgi:hypothetical protein